MSIAATSGTGVRRKAPGSGTSAQAPTAKVIGALLLGALPALILAVIVAREGFRHPLVLPLAVVVFAVNAVIVVQDIRNGVALFILAAGLSPKLPGLYENLRVEDFIFVVVFGLWLFRQTPATRLANLRSPIVQPFIVLTVVSLLSTIWGAALGRVPDLAYSALLQFKRVEYFLIFWVVATTVKSEQWLRILTLLFVFSGAGCAMYGFLNPSVPDYTSAGETRVVGPEGENYNTLSGYLVVCIGAGVGVLPDFRKGFARLLLIASISLAALGVLFSFSREGLIMLMGALLFFGFTRYRILLIAAAVAFVVALGVADPVRENLSETFNLIQNSREADPGANSLTARYRAWEYRWNGWFVQQPLFGNGVGSVALSVDNEYLLRACETGILGFGVFIWWLTAIGKQVVILRRKKGLVQTMSFGLASGFVGLLIQALVACSFTTIRTMEAFWFWLGLVAAANLIQTRADREAAEAQRRAEELASKQSATPRRRVPSVGW